MTDRVACAPYCVISSRLLVVGAAQKHVNETAAKNVALHLLPTPVQQAIVHPVRALRSKVHRLESIYGSELAALDELERSLLHEAFSGLL